VKKMEKGRLGQPIGSVLCSSLNGVKRRTTRNIATTLELQMTCLSP
jgi:hypothetical protein